MFQSLSAKDKQLQIQMGLDTSGTGQAFVARDIAGYTPANQSVQVYMCMLTAAQPLCELYNDSIMPAC